MMDGLIATSVVLQVINFWLISKGRLVYPLIITVYLMYIVVEGWLAWRDPAQTLVWMYCALNAWAVYCAIKGWHYQHNKEKQ